MEILAFHDFEYFFPPPSCLQGFFWEISWQSNGNSFVGNCLLFSCCFLSIILGNVIMMCLGMWFLGSNFFGTHWDSWTSWKSIYFARWGKFFFIMFSNKFSISCFSFSPSGTPMIWMLEHLKFPQRFLSLSSFFWILVSSFCSSWMFISSFCYKYLIWVPVSFPWLLVPCTFSFVSLSIGFIFSSVFRTDSSYLFLA